MQQRMNISKIAPELYRQVAALNRAVNDSGLDVRLLHLLKVRASQINGCGYCIDLHIKESLRDGIDQQTLNLVVAWRESPLFDARDRAALELTESVTLVAGRGVSDEVWAQAQAVFSEQEIAQLLYAISTINVWNRLMVASRTPHSMEKM